MRIPLSFLIVVIAFSLLVDGYIYLAARRRCASPIPSWLQLVSALALYVALIVGVSMPRRSGGDASLIAIMWVLFGYMTFLVPKIVFTDMAVGSRGCHCAGCISGNVVGRSGQSFQN